MYYSVPGVPEYPVTIFRMKISQGAQKGWDLKSALERMPSNQIGTVRCVRLGDCIIAVVHRCGANKSTMEIAILRHRKESERPRSHMKKLESALHVPSVVLRYKYTNYLAIIINRPLFILFLIVSCFIQTQ